MPAPATPPTTPVARLRNPGELLAALPYLIGFHPRDSLLFIAFGGSSGRRIELTQRVDLPGADDAPVVCRALAANTLRAAPTGVAVVVVGGDQVVAGGVPFGGPPPLGELAAAAAEALAAHGVPVQSRTWAAGTGAGAAWACYDDCGCRGAVPDAGETPFAATAVAAGLVARTDRADLEKVVAPTTPARLRRRARMLTRAVDALDASGTGITARAGRRRGRRGARRRRTRPGRRWSSAHSRTPRPGGCASTTSGWSRWRWPCPIPRCATRRWAAAPGRAPTWTARNTCGQRWSGRRPTRRPPNPPRCSRPAPCFGATGRWPGSRCDRAEQAWPGHRLSRLLRAVWAAGIPPERVRDCLTAPLPPTMPVPRVAGRSKRRTRR